MKTIQLHRYLIPIIAVLAVGSFGLQQQRMARAQLELKKLQSENASLPALRDAVAELQKMEIDEAELVRLRQDQAAHQRELARTRALASRTLRAETEAAAARAQLEQRTAHPPVEARGIAGPMAAMTQDVLEQRNQRQLAQMRERLDLTPLQADGIRDILDRRAQETAEAMKEIFSGKMDSAKLASLRDGRGDPESQILDLLTPNQQAAYAQMRDEERANAAFTSANNELIQMRNTLGLRDHQEDQVFEILHADALRVQFPLESDDLPPANPAEEMEIVMERKLVALATVLTAEQLAGYRQQQELQLRFLQGVMGGMQAAREQP